MNKAHVTLIALLMAIAAVFATVALTRTSALGTASRRAADTAYQARVTQLNAYAASLQRTLRAVPASTSGSTPPTTKIVYHRPPPIVIVKHTQHGDDGSVETQGNGDD
jgi:hypothetical protein